MNLKNQLIHIVLSHQGKLEFASPIEPKTLEAIVLYQADELSAKTNAYKYAIEADKNKEGNWTRFLPLANTSLYTKRDITD
jgi:3'-5' exoribonuclease